VSEFSSLLSSTTNQNFQQAAHRMQNLKNTGRLSNKTDGARYPVMTEQDICLDTLSGALRVYRQSE
jgi:hypothetical protein